MRHPHPPQLPQRPGQIHPRGPRIPLQPEEASTDGDDDVIHGDIILRTGDSLDGPEEGLHVLLAGGLVLVEVGARAGQLELAVGSLALVGLVAFDLI